MYRFSLFCSVFIIGACMSTPLVSDSAFDQRVKKIVDNFEKQQTDLNNNSSIDSIKKLSIPKIRGSESPQEDNIHDAKNSALAVLQDPADAMKDFPRDRHLQVDWVQTLEQGQIDPRANMSDKGKMEIKQGDIIMKNTQYMPWVKFPHSTHTKWLACKNCHPAIFVAKEHANQITMNKVLRGEYCGVCHDKVAFSLFICERCHSLPHKGSGPKWW